MEKVLEEKLALVNKTLEEMEIYQHACQVLNYDLETICPPKAMEEQGEVQAALQNVAFKLTKDPAFVEAAEYLHAHRSELDEFDRALADSLHRQYLKTKNISPELQREFSSVYNKAFVTWLEAKQKADFGIFAPSLQDVIRINRQDVSLREEAKPELYDNLLDDYERGLTGAALDECFGRCKERLIPLLQRIMKSRKVIRTDFLSRFAPEDQQRRFARYLLELMQYDFTRGAFTTSEHPFTDGLGKNDVRITTRYQEDMFTANMYTITHEGGHALFEMLQPRENFAHHIQGLKSMSMHESVSRFYENRIGRSASFIRLVYPKIQELFPAVMEGVTEQELYEAVNLVTPSLIRTEADEFTYTFHIIIRYEMEKAMLSGEAKIEELPELWNRKYEEYLGIRPGNDSEGILQDVHWTFGMGYFPTYALGNMYNAMYYNRMAKELDINALVADGDFAAINSWMAQNVFARADRLDAHSWIREITGRDFTPDDFLDYLEEKYGRIYELD